MNRATAAQTLRELLGDGDGDQSEYGQALALAIRTLDPPPRAPKQSRNVTAFLKIAFPANVAAPAHVAADESAVPREVRVQFEYGRERRYRRTDTNRKFDPAILHAART